MLRNYTRISLELSIFSQMQSPLGKLSQEQQKDISQEAVCATKCFDNPGSLLAEDDHGTVLLNTL